MQIDPEVLALRHSTRPGYRFVGFREVAIPVLFLNVRAVISQQRGLPTADEFVLRCVAAGMDTIHECSCFLGLSPSLVEHRVIELRTMELLDIDCCTNPERVRLRLTATGEGTVRTLTVQEVCEETLRAVPFHGWMRQPLSCLEAETLSAKDADERNLVKLRPVPSEYPQAADIDARKLTEAIHFRHNRRSQPDIEVLAVKAVLRGTRTRYLPALLMQWQSTASGRPQVGFVFNGRTDEGLERRFGEIGGSDVFSDVLALDPLTPDELIDQSIPLMMRQKVKGALVPNDQAVAISQAALELAAHKEAAAKVPEGDLDRPDTRVVQAKRIAELEEAIRQQEQALGGRRPRYIWTAEIRHNFEKALQIAKSRLVIASAFVNNDVVNAEFITKVEASIGRGAEVYLLIGDDDMAQGDSRKMRAREAALASIEALRLRHADKLQVVLQHHHAKILVCDSHFAMSGSYNFLSFRGDHRRVRHENAIILTDPADIDRLTTDLMQRFFRGRPAHPETGRR